MKTIIALVLFAVSSAATARPSLVPICQPRTHHKTGEVTYRTMWLPKKLAERRVEKRDACFLDAETERVHHRKFRWKDRVPCTCEDENNDPAFSVVAAAAFNMSQDETGSSSQFYLQLNTSLVTQFTEFYDMGFTNLKVTASTSTDPASTCSYSLMVDPFTSSNLTLPVVMQTTGFGAPTVQEVGGGTSDSTLIFSAENDPNVSMGLTSAGVNYSVVNALGICDPAANGPMDIKIELFKP